MKAVALGLSGLALALAGCSLAPKYQRPEVAQPAAFKEPLPAGWNLAEPADEQAKGDWWTAFGDATLNSLQARVVVGNQNLKAALARYDQARAAAGLARASAVPLISLGASTSRTRISANSAHYVPGSSPLSNDFNLGLNLSYELDVWGRVRNAVRAGDALVQASAADLQTLQLSLRSELASDYFMLRGDELTQQVLSQALDADAQALDLTQRRYKGGLVTELDVDQARLQLENARTTLADLKLKSRQLVNAIALLVGEPASSFNLPAGTLPAATLAVPLEQPSTLLQRRPDVAAAERRVRAANADIGVARAGYFPTLSISANAGFDSTRTATLFDTPSHFWAIGPQALLNLFDGGRNKANVNAARAVLDEASANYRQVVLTAYREAEDSLVAINQLSEEAASQQAAQDAAQRAFDQARRQYTGGLVTYLPVATAQAALAQAQQASIGIHVAQLTARIQLVKALGGEWQSAPPVSMVPSAKPL